MRRFSFNIVLALCTLLFASISSAQQTSTTDVPNLIRYSGTLKDAQGAVPSGTPLGVTFAIYKQQDGGAPVWQETQNVTPDANGQYSVILGSTTATGLPGDLFSQQEQRWLGIQAQGQAEQARVLLVSVPYAFKAHEAETLGGLPPSAFVKAQPSDASGATGTDTGTAVNALSNTGNIGASNAKSGAGKAPSLGCTPIPGYITYWDSNDDLCASYLFQAGQGNIGIGTSSPSTALDVNGIINARKWYDIGNSELAFASTGFNNALAMRNTFVGLYAGTNFPRNPPNTPSAEADNTFIGYYAGSNTKPNPIAATGSSNTFTGSYAGGANTSGYNNAFFGHSAGYGNLSGDSNVYIGYASAYYYNARGNTFVGTGTGFKNTANNGTFMGLDAGYNNIADGNTFVGYQAGSSNIGGYGNTFFGYQAGYTNEGPNENTFLGFQAGYSNKGPHNTFLGYQAGYSNTTGMFNAYVGVGAGTANSDGFANTFIGSEAGSSDTHGQFNTFVGQAAGSSNLTGIANTFVGSNAGDSFDLGGQNIFLGVNAGENNSDGTLDIYIGNEGCPYPCSESNFIRIGDEQHNTYVAGIYNSIAGDSATTEFVCVDQSGKLWGQLNPCEVITGGGGPGSPSSRRFKEQIADMGDSSSKLFQLRPVTFFYKPQYDDGSHLQQYGLIAEEVAKVYPDMVAYDKDGQPYTVKYQYLAPMLLNELQKQHTVVTAQQDVIKTQQEQVIAQQQRMQAQQQQIEQMQQRLARLESLIANKQK